MQSEPTVTMTLSDFKEMEGKCKALDMIRSGEHGTILLYRFYSTYGDYIVIGDEANAKLVRDLKSAVTMRDDVIKTVREYEQKTGKTVFQQRVS